MKNGRNFSKWLNPYTPFCFSSVESLLSDQHYNNIMSSTTLTSTARDFKPTFILLLEVSASFKKFSDILGDGRDIEDFPSS